MDVTDGADWIKAHATVCKKAGKPCLFEECKWNAISQSDLQIANECFFS